jgi:hypothetical protein
MMVIRQHTTVDFCARQAPDIRRLHAVIDPLRPGLVAGSDTRLQIDDARRGCRTFQLGERIAPYVRIIRGTGNRAVHPLGKRDVVSCVVYVALVQGGRARMLQDLVDAAASHDVAAEE